MKPKGKPKKDTSKTEITSDATARVIRDKPQKENSSSFDNLRRFFDKVTSIGIIDRIFGWNAIRSLSYDAYNEFKSFESTITNLHNSFNSEKHNNSLLNQNLEHQKSENARLGKEIEDLNRNYASISKEYGESQKNLSKHKTSEESKQKQLDDLQKKYEQLEFKYSDLTKINKEHEKEIAEYNATKEEKEKQYEERINKVNQLHQQLESDRQKVQLERETELRQEFDRKKECWKVHERSVESKLKEICNLHGIEYVDKEHVPFKGKPDNILKIAGEFVIFDAKSPQSDDLTNFPAYISQQAEAIKKYVKEENVKKDLFLIVPVNTLNELERFYYNMAEYNVYVLPPDAMEPILMSLRKIEDYDFAEQLSPDERENICRVLGKFAHATKRRAQVDFYFFKEFANIWNNCLSLPSDILDKVVEFEKSDKMNPPQEKRAKAIPLKELDSIYNHSKQEAKAKEVNPDVDVGVKEK